MTSTPLDTLVASMVEQILQAVPAGDWPTVQRLADAVEALSPGNEDASIFRSMAVRMGGGAPPLPPAAAAQPRLPASMPPAAITGATPGAAMGAAIGVATTSFHAHSHALDDVLASVAGLAPFSMVAGKLLDLLDDEFSTLDEIAALAGTEPVLTGRILTAANSAFYQRRVRVGTIRDAVIVLGAQEVRSIVVATCLVGAMPSTKFLDHSAFWRFSLAVGLLADMIARSEGAIGGEAFTSGITHNVGLLILDHYCPEGLRETTQIVADGRRRLHDRELAVFGFTDADLGSRLAVQWGLPPTVVRAIASHGVRRDEVSDRDLPASAVVRARMYVRAQGMSDGIERSEPRDLGADLLPASVRKRIHGMGGWDGMLERMDALLASTR